MREKPTKRNFAEVKRLYPDVRTIDYNELKEAVGQGRHRHRWPALSGIF